MLEVDRLSRAFGGVYAARDVSLSVADGELRGVIGPNGAGKSTLFTMISGHLHPHSGRITLDGEHIDRLPPHRRARRGVAIVFQGARIFPGMSVLANVAVGATARTRAGAASAVLRLPRHRREEREIFASAREALARVGLADWADRDAEQLPLGQQRRLQLARALTARPKLPLLDEPASGLRASERRDLSQLIRELARRRHDHHADRARRVDGDVAGRPHHRPGSRRGHRRRHSRRDPPRPARDLGVPGQGGRGMMLTIDDLVVRYGAATALDGVSLTVDDAELVALVGPNGAGKTSLVNAISGLVKTVSGRIEVGGRVAQVPEGRQMFGELSVEDNLRLGAWRHRPKDIGPVYELLPDLQRLRRQRADTLSGGQQQMVAVGRALMAQPDLLVVDELSLGLAPMVAAQLVEHLAELNRSRGTAVLLIEQEIGLAFELCSRAYVLESGQIVTEGPTAQLRDAPELQDAYFGGLDPNATGV
ncbi:ATP-binding cassette domain-containing protein [Microbacterium elymi]|uniref:ATP-binding cassette domain-containing protein n=1 Tax=Microbacterium elymi TaxID=2909587 RepID=A0ABY5NLY2_9MICO|nr:ATP-binding cassette domain-containing protein [Microbacterium elymi]UUT36198.1 ATP-binding cassette domain-containing protein [Microbacterium elymi]